MIDHATDAAGRSGVGVGMHDPRLGLVQFLGDADHMLDFNSALQRVAVVDGVGQVP